MAPITYEQLAQEIKDGQVTFSPPAAKATWGSIVRSNGQTVSFYGPPGSVRFNWDADGNIKFDKVSFNMHRGDDEDRLSGATGMEAELFQKRKVFAEDVIEAMDKGLTAAVEGNPDKWFGNAKNPGQASIRNALIPPPAENQNYRYSINFKLDTISRGAANEPVHHSNIKLDVRDATKGGEPVPMNIMDLQPSDIVVPYVRNCYSYVMVQRLGSLSVASYGITYRLEGLVRIRSFADNKRKPETDQYSWASAIVNANRGLVQADGDAAGDNGAVDQDIETAPTKVQKTNFAKDKAGATSISAESQGEADGVERKDEPVET